MATRPRDRADLVEGVMVQWLMKWLGVRRRVAWLAVLCLGLLGADAMALSCPADREASGGLCYVKPRDGYSCTATLCVQNCRDGYHSTGIGTCHYSGSTTYTQRPYIRRSHSSMQRCGALFYNNCRDGYRMDACGVCSYKGAWDITRSSYDRGPGTNPDVSAAFNRLSDTARATWGRVIAAIQVSSAQMLAALQGLVQDQLYKAARTVGKEVLDNKATSCLLKDVGTRLAVLKKDADSLNVLKRLVAAGGAGKFDPQVALDMVFIASKLGLVDNKLCGYPILPSKMSFGVYGQVELVAGAGANSTVGIAMNLPLSSSAISSLDPRAFISQGFVFGPELVDSTGIGVFIALADVSSLNGPGVSVGFDIDVVAGGNAGVGFNIPDRLPAFDITRPLETYTNWLHGLSPSVSVGLSTGEGGGGAVTLGYGATTKLK